MKKAYELRDAAIAAYREGEKYTEEDPDFDPGDSYVRINGNRYNVCTVLFLLNAIGVEGCEV